MVRIKYFFFLLFFMLIALFFFLKNKEEKRLIHAMEHNLRELKQKVQDTPSKTNDLTLQLTQKQQKQLKTLKSKFKSYTYNGENTWLKHQGFVDESLEDSLLAIINQKGEISLFSNYIGTKPLVHYAIQLKIGEIYVDSVRVIPAINQHPIFVKGITQIHESIYLKDENAKILIEQIALNKEAEIEVKLIGKNAFTSFILTEESKQAFSETWALLKLLTV